MMEAREQDQQMPQADFEFASPKLHYINVPHMQGLMKSVLRFSSIPFFQIFFSTLFCFDICLIK